MIRVSDVYNLDASVVGTLVQVGGVLLSSSSDTFVLADSIEEYDHGVAVPLLDDDLLERLVTSGVYGIGGGRFSYRYRTAITAVFAGGARGYAVALTNIASLTVNYLGNDVSVIPTMEGR